MAFDAVVALKSYIAPMIRMRRDIVAKLLLKDMHELNRLTGDEVNC
jgi:hypothetical protein